MLKPPTSCSYQQLRRKGRSATLVHYESPEWTTMKCGVTRSVCRDHSRCLARIEPVLPPAHRGPICGPACVVVEARDARDEADGAEAAGGDPAGATSDESVSVVDGFPCGPKHLADMEKTMHVV